MKSKSSRTKTAGSLFLALVLAVSALVVPAAAAESNTAAIAFANTGEGEDKISLSEERTYEATLTLDASVTEEQAKALADSVTWTLSREKGMQDESKFPYQYLGGPLADWTCWDTTDPLFTDIATTAVTVDGAQALKLTFTNAYFFGKDRIDNPRANRNVILDYTGDYTLTCTDAAGNVLGTAAVRVNPYDSYHTNAEFYEALAAANDYIAGRSDMYAEIRSMGTTTDGYDMPYIIIADSKQTISDYETLKEQAEKDPAAVLKQLEAGTLDYKIPVLYSNVHADENPGADAPMAFINMLAYSDQVQNKLSYEDVTGFTEAGKAQLEKELEERNVHTSVLLEDWPTYLGFLQDGNGTSGQVDLEKYYTLETKTVDVNELLEDVFFIVVPEENADARTYNIRQNGNGFDLNRDNMFQTQVETRNMTAMVAYWNPATFIELHGFVGGFQIEPCSPPHEPNVEYDLFAENGLKAGEAFGTAAIANNSKYQSYVMPLRDYLTEDEDGNPYWAEPWDDMSTNYTPQYSLLHGTVAYTIEVPASNEQATKALTYGLLGHGAYVAAHKDAFFKNQVTGYLRGVNNEDVAAIRDWYVDMHDNVGAEAEVYRPINAENNNFFPECYIIPLDAASQKNLPAAYEMWAFLLRNDVQVSKLTEDVTVDGVTYQAGSLVVSMYQAKRNVANGALYDGCVITGWVDLYSEPITNFGQLRGFDYAKVWTKGLVTDAMLTDANTAEAGKTAFSGVEGKEVVIANASVDAVAAVNALLKGGAKVGMVTEGTFTGDFVVSYDAFQSVKDNYILTAVGVEAAPTAQIIGQPTLYIPGFAGDYSKNSAGQPYGVKNYPNYGNTNYNFDKFAFGQQMGFQVTDDPSQADIIVGNRALDAAALAAVKNGTPYLAYGSAAVQGVKESLLADTAFAYASENSIQDALFYAEYPADSLITASYVADGDDVMYGYGGVSISAVPEGAEVLITVSDKPLVEGFFEAKNLEAFYGSIQAFTYAQNGLDLTVFANSLTNKAHQQDDYRYASNTIFSKMLGADYQSGYTDIDGFWAYDAILAVTKAGLFSGVTPTAFGPDQGVTRGMFVTVLHRMAGAPEAAAAAFSDVAADRYYAKAVDWAKATGVASGVGETVFAPDTLITREQMVAMLYNYAKQKGTEAAVTTDLSAYGFVDAASVSDWAMEGVLYAAGNGLVNGKPGNLLAPQDTATRAEAATILAKLIAE